MELSIFQMIASGVLALFVGLLTGVFGVGGGFLMTPALIILIGIPGPIAVGTGLVNFFANSTLGVIKRRGSGTVAPSIAILVGGGSMLGVVGGSWILEHLNRLPHIEIGGQQQSPLELVLMIVFFLLLSGIAVFMTWDLRQSKKSDAEDTEHQVGLLSHIPIPPYRHFDVLDVPRMSIPALLMLGILAGVLTGLLGIGGGVIMLPALIYLVGMRTQKATGTSLLLVWIASFTGAIQNLFIGNVHGILLLILMAGGMSGTWLGTHLAFLISGNRTKQYFIYVLLLAVLLVVGRIIAMVF
jgi:uncharacterized membrane protein YfcA